MKRTTSISLPPGVNFINQDQVVGRPNQVEPLVQLLRTRRSKTIIHFTLEDFSRIHTQYTEKNRSAFIETPIYSFYENERIRFQLKFYPSKHAFIMDAFYRGTEQSAQLFIDAYLLDSLGRKFAFDFNRKVECQVTPQSSESLGNFVYDRDDLERKRDRLFKDDKLVLGVEVNATWVDVAAPGNQNEL
jgi:hypothetical protein